MAKQLHVLSSPCSYVSRQGDLIFQHLVGTRVLDFGCGDLTLAADLVRRLPKLRITGVDVVHPGRKEKGIRFVRYDGVTLPFGDTVFDTTIAYHVFHHCTHPAAALSEVARVTRRRIVFVEPVYRSKGEIPFMRIVDCLANSRRGGAIPMPYEFRSAPEWTDMVRRIGWHVESVHPAGVLPEFLPIGVTRLFVAEPADT